MQVRQVEEADIDMEVGDIPMEAAYMALCTEPEEVCRGSEAVRKELEEVDLLLQAELERVLTWCQLEVSWQLTYQNDWSSEGLEGLHQLCPLPPVQVRINWCICEHEK